MNKLSPTLRRMARKLDGHFSFIDHQDLYQEALVHLWLHFKSGELDDKTDSYILQGCYFHLKNYIRKLQNSVPIISLSSTVDDDGPYLSEILAANEVDSYDRMEGMLQIEALAQSGMSQRERDVLIFCLEGMTTREIGTKLGISHVRVAKIRNKIGVRYEKLNGINANNGTN